MTKQVRQKPKIAWQLIIALFLVIIGVSTFFLLSKPDNEPSATKLASTTGLIASKDLVIPVSGISAQATFYPMTVNGTKLEVLAVKAPDGTIRTAFNTCQVCYSSGRGYYKQEGNVLVCQNCGNRFNMSDVEVSKGGCNPVPIFDKETTMTETSITISGNYLMQATKIFQNWK